MGNPVIDSNVEKFNPLILNAPNSERGNFLILGIDNVSYYPSLKVQRLISLNVYGIDTSRHTLEGNDRFKEYQKRYEQDLAKYGYTKPNLSRGNFVEYPLEHHDVDGDLIVLRDDEGLLKCLMNIRGITEKNERNPEVNLSIISPNALMPYMHTVNNMGNGGRGGYGATFYTIDQDGSRWSIHAWKCKQ